MSEKTKKKAVIFGASLKGREAYANYKPEYNIAAFADNDKSKWGAELCGVKIIAPGDIKALGETVIIVASMYWSEISSQLYAMGYENIMIYFSEHNERTAVKYKLIPMCGISAFSKLHVSREEAALFASDFENIFIERPEIKSPSDEIIYRDKNVLFFAYFFPPIGSSGVQRSLKFVKYLRGLGWNPIVVSCGDFRLNYAYDESLLDEIPGDITVIRIDDRTTIVDELTAAEMRQAVNLLGGALGDSDALDIFLEKIKENGGSLRKHFFYPQSVNMWVLDVLSLIPQIIDFDKIHAVYVTSGPYLSSLIGYYIKNKYKKPWVMDFRDPWSQGVNAGEKPDWLSGLEFALEKSMLEKADHIIAVSHICAGDYKNIFGIPAEKISLILNGYDEADFKTVDTEAPGPNDKLKIVFNGVLIEVRSSPLSFINAVNEAISEGSIAKSEIEIELVGERKPKSLEGRIKAADIHGVVSLKPYTEHIESLKNLSGANVLLIIALDIEGNINMYTGKVFEYLRMNRRILALVPRGNILEALFADTGKGVCIHPDDKEGIKKYLMDTLSEIKAGKTVAFDKAETEKFERKKGAEALSGILDGLLQ